MVLFTYAPGLGNGCRAPRRNHVTPHSVRLWFGGWNGRGSGHKESPSTMLVRVNRVSTGCELSQRCPLHLRLYGPCLPHELDPGGLAPLRAGTACLSPTWCLILKGKRIAGTMQDDQG